MLLKFLIAFLADFGFSGFEPLLTLAVGAFLIVLPIVVRRFRSAAAKAAQPIHETLGGA